MLSRYGYCTIATEGGAMANTVECPVCGMQVDPDNAPASDIYDDQTYVFCSTTCRDAFDKDPGRYVGNTGS